MNILRKKGICTNDEITAEIERLSYKFGVR